MFLNIKKNQKENKKNENQIEKNDYRRILSSYYKQIVKGNHILNY
jgi:hypothetical protein